MDWIENAVHFVDWLTGDPFPTNKFLEEPPIKERATPDKRSTR